MYFANLQLTNFRNFNELSVDFVPGVNIFVGKNGQGKSNLLEALYILSNGESFRYAENSNFILYEQREAILRSKIRGEDFNDHLSMQILSSKKNAFLHNKKTSTAEVQKMIPTILFSPESLASIKEGDDQRRQLLDQLIQTTSPNNLQVIQDYRKALRTRNRILKDYVEGKTDDRVTSDLLESLNPQFMRLAVQLVHLRLQAIRDVAEDFKQTMHRISGLPSSVDISVEYVISGENAGNFDLQQINNSLHKRAQELRSAELASGTSLVGPHKHDVTFLYDQKDSRFYCSQGQQRALILAFKIAQIVYHRRVRKSEPVLMLDDVLSELDSEKRMALIGFLREIKSQVFITTTDLTLPATMSDLVISVSHIEQGKIRERSAI